MVESFRYDESYGTILEHIKSEETLNPYCYTGREFESKELYYYRARYYDPSIGRFISSDPIEFMAGDFNFYRYVGNEPVGWVDPFGLFLDTSKTSATQNTRQTEFRGNTAKISKPSVGGVLNKSAKGGILAPIVAFCVMCKEGYETITSIEEDVKSHGGTILSPEEDALPMPEVATEAQTATATDTVTGEEEKQKCKKICFEISTATYPDVKDIYGNKVAIPNAGKEKVPFPGANRKSTTYWYRKTYAEKYGKKPKSGQMHHIRPLWANGDELSAENLVPIKDGHTGENSLHEWWGNQLKEKTSGINKKIEACAKENGVSGEALSECKIGAGNQYPKGSRTNISIGEVGITVASKCLKSKGVDLSVGIDYPCPK